MAAQRYVLGQGKVYLDEFDATTGLKVGKGRFVGNVPNGGLTLQMQIQKIEHPESYTGENLTDLVIERQKKSMGMVKLENIDRANLMLALYGSSASIAGATVSAEAHTAYKGHSFFLSRINLTSFTSLTDTASTPVTFVNGTDYTVDLKSGEVFIIAAGAITDALAVRANYVAATSERVNAYSAVNKELWMRFNGVNNADGNKPIVFDAYKVRFSPAKSIDLITDQQVVSLELDFEVLYQDALANVSGYEGGFFRILQTAVV